MDDVQGLIRESARRHNVDPDFALRIAHQESSFNPSAIGKPTPYGQARGVFQLMPKTAKQYGVTDPFDARQNVEGGIKFLADLQKEFGGDRRKMLIAYNSRRENVNKPTSQLPRETQAYIPAILGKDMPQSLEPGQLNNLLKSPRFRGLKPEEQVKVWSQASPEFGSQPPGVQTQIMSKLIRQSEPEPSHPGPVRPPIPARLAKPLGSDPAAETASELPGIAASFRRTEHPTTAQQIGQDLLLTAAGFKGTEMATGRFEGPRTAPRYGEPAFPPKPGPIRQAAAQARADIAGKTAPQPPPPFKPIAPTPNLRGVQQPLELPRSAPAWREGPAPIPREAPPFEPIPQTETPSGRSTTAKPRPQAKPPEPGEARKAAAIAREQLSGKTTQQEPKPIESIKPDEAALRAQREARKAQLEKEIPPPKAEAPKEPPAKKPAATESDIYRQKGQMHGTHIERATIAKDANIGRFLKSKGFTKDMLDKMSEDQWKTTVQEVNKAYGTSYETKTRSIQSLMKRIGEIKNHLKESPAGTAFPKTSLMRAPDGTTKEIPADQVEHYRSRGAEVINA